MMNKIQTVLNRLADESGSVEYIRLVNEQHIELKHIRWTGKSSPATIKEVVNIYGDNLADTVVNAIIWFFDNTH